jgi:superfamily II DNA or RNA helicase
MELSELVRRTHVEPRPYQARIVSKAVEMFEGQHQNGLGHVEPAARSVMIESPTGSGKTVMGLLTAKLLQERHGLTVGWVAMRRNLLVQTAEENRRQGIDVDPMHFVSMFDKEPPTGIDLLVVDEAQHDAASSMAFLHNRIRPKYILGLTATPFRCDRVKLCFDKVIKDAGIHQLIQDGYLSQYEHYTVPNFDVESVSDFYLREPERWGMTIVFFHRLSDCFECEAILRGRGVRCETVTGTSDREAQIERFRAGESPVLINCMVLTEGFDCPDLETVFCRDSAKGPTMQMCGRAFRKHPTVPFKRVVQSKLTRYPFTKIASARRAFALVASALLASLASSVSRVATRNWPLVATP